MTPMLLIIVALAAGPTTANVTADRADLRLSEHATLTLTVEGDAPLRVTPPAAWLPGVDATWRLRPLRPARLDDLSPTRQRWTLRLRADPDVPGEGPLQLAPVRVLAGTDDAPREVAFPPLAMRVVATVVLGRDGPRPPTEVEAPAPSTPTASLVMPVTIGVAVGVVLVAAIVRGRRSSSRSIEQDSARSRFERELDSLRGDAVPDALFPAQLSAAVRAYIEDVDGLPALRRTPREIEPLAVGAERLQPLPELLRQCDDARFSETPVSAETRTLLLAAAAKLAPGSP